jgi:hypothetical protein
MPLGCLHLLEILLSQGPLVHSCHHHASGCEYHYEENQHWRKG